MGQINEFSIPFRAAFPSVMKGVCGQGMENPLGDNSLLAMAGKVCFITEKNPPASFESIIDRLFPIPKEKLYYRLPVSEKAKSLAETEKLCSFLYDHGFSRNSIIAACGGGAVTDAAGFAASIYMRGIRWISVPTTFLGQIDAGIGGKTAVNLASSKNIIGSFWQPSALVLEADFLASLPKETLRSGAGELVKYALLMQPAESRTIQDALPGVLSGDLAKLMLCVSVCANMKMRLISKDERDQYALREKLNLGHTAGHAFEAMSNGRLPHGEAVAHGLKYAIILSKELEKINEMSADAMLGLVAMLDLANLDFLGNDEASFASFLKLVSHDKKNIKAENRFILPKDFGIAEPMENIPESILRIAYDRMLGF